MTTDNDFFQTRASLFYAFAVDREELPGYEAQVVREHCGTRGDDDDDDDHDDDDR